MSAGKVRYTHESTEQHVARLEAQIGDLKLDMKRQMDGVRGDIQGLVDAWKTAGLVVVFIKWLAAIGVAIVGIKAGWHAMWGPK